MDQGAGDLDDLTPAQVAALEVGVLQLDFDGRVLLANRAAARLVGLEPEDTVGRNFFKEAAPSTARPGFYGRFLEGVRRGRLQDSFDFTFSGGDQAVRARVRLIDARAPERCWVVLDSLRPVAALRGIEAAEAVGRRARAEPLDAGVCEREPIHIPGAVQPHAALLVVEPDAMTVVACSDNLAEITGVAPGEALGRPLEALAPELTEAVRAWRSTGAREPEPRLSLTTPVGPERILAAVSAHLRDDRLLIELEPAPVRGADFGAPGVSALAGALGGLGLARSLTEAAQTAAEAVRELTGFQRVLIYRFDRDWNGVAIAEARDPAAYPSLLGLHFPASDIPAQARALYTRAPLRFMFDRDYAPSALVGQAGRSPADRAETGWAEAPLDLSLVQARSLSPIHLEYQRNLGVDGSMSASILVDGELWGLVIGHHTRPHYLAPETRLAAAAVTEALALRIAKFELEEAWRSQEAHVAAETRLLERMVGADDLAEALAGGSPTLADLFEAEGAAVVDGEEVTLLGRTPARNEVLQLSAWLQSQGLVYASEHLSRDFPAAEAYPDTASGLLAAFTGEERRRLLLWFKPEEVSTVAWGGDPHKAVDTDGGAVLPRRSFERWVEERRGASMPWRPWQAAAAGRIAGAVEKVALRHNRRVAVLNAKHDQLLAALSQKDQLLADKDLLTREIDHRVKNSLQIVASFVQMQSRATADPEARAGLEETYGRVMSVARIHDSLWRSDEVGEVDIGQTIEVLCRDLSGMAGEGRTLAVRTAQDVKVPYQQALSLSLIAVELVTNALKYAYAPGEAGAVEVDVRSEPSGGVCLIVSDRGRGLPADWAVGRRESGLGMKLITAMLTQIKGEMRVESEQGSRFVVCA